MGRHTKAFDDQPGRDDHQGTRTSNQPPARPPRQVRPPSPDPLNPSSAPAPGGARPPQGEATPGGGRRPHPRDTRVSWDQSYDQSGPRDSYGQGSSKGVGGAYDQSGTYDQSRPQGRDRPRGRGAPSSGRQAAHGQEPPDRRLHRRRRAGGDPSNAETRSDLKPIRPPAVARPASAGETERRVRMPWIGKVPLLPTVAGIIAVGMVATAYGTSTISLNFTGGGTPAQSQANPQCGDVGCPASSQSGDTTGGTVPATPVSVSFGNVPRPDGFKGTVTISNHGAGSVRGWTLSFTIPGAQVYSVTGATVLKQGSSVSLRSSATLTPGATTHVIFFARGTANTPTTCTFNKAACDMGESNG